jgi:hypothetical protein
MAIDSSPSTKLAVLDPMGYPPKVVSKPLSPRLETLDGKTVYLVDPRFDDSGNFLIELKKWFDEYMPNTQTKIVQMSKVYHTDDPKLWQEVKENADAAIVGVGH